jgi:hypothetical protein
MKNVCILEFERGIFEILQGASEGTGAQKENASTLYN